MYPVCLFHAYANVNKLLYYESFLPTNCRPYLCWLFFLMKIQKKNNVSPCAILTRNDLTAAENYNTLFLEKIAFHWYIGKTIARIKESFQQTVSKLLTLKTLTKCLIIP